MITLRLASAEDAAAIAHVHVAGWQHYRGLIPDAYLDRLDAAVYANRWAERLVAPEHGESTFTLVADDPPGNVIGFAYGSRAEDEDPALGEVRAIYVLAERRRDGAGRKLVTALAARLGYLGCRALVIWVLAENPSARRFYEALGGHPVHTRTREFGGAALPEIGYRWDHLKILLHPLVLSPPDPGWTEALAEERRRLAAALDWTLEVIEPIGSTAVPGLLAKPILDLMAGPPGFPLPRPQILAAARLGYDYHAAAGIPGRQFFGRSGPQPPAAHLHVVAHGSDFWWSHLRFRDFLRAHPIVAAEYGALKQKIAQASGGDRVAYTVSKGAFIASVLAQAQGEQPATSSGRPGPPV